MTVTYDNKGALHKCTFALVRAFPGMRAFHASQAVVIWSWAFSHAILRAARVSGSWQCISEQDTKANVILAGSTSFLYQLRMQCLPTRAYQFVLVDLCQLCRLLFPNWACFWFTVWGQGHCSSLCV